MRKSPILNREGVKSTSILEVGEADMRVDVLVQDSYNVYVNDAREELDLNIEIDAGSDDIDEYSREGLM